MYRKVRLPLATNTAPGIPNDVFSIRPIHCLYLIFIRIAFSLAFEQQTNGTHISGFVINWTHEYGMVPNMKWNMMRSDGNQLQQWNIQKWTKIINTFVSHECRYNIWLRRFKLFYWNMSTVTNGWRLNNTFH